MIIWTPELAPPIQKWIDSATERILCCKLSEWNGTDYPDFELSLSNQFGVTCLPLHISNEDSSKDLDSIWNYLAGNKTLIHDYISRQHEVRRSILFQQYENGEQLDLGYYDYIDLLSHLEERVILCIRAMHSFHPNLLTWLDYIVNKTEIKVFIFNNIGVFQASCHYLTNYQATCFSGFR